MVGEDGGYVYLMQDVISREEDDLSSLLELTPRVWATH